MKAATLPCPTCACTGEDTHEDRHTGTNKDICRTCGGTGWIEPHTGETAEASFQPPAGDGQEGRTAFAAWEAWFSGQTESKDPLASCHGWMAALIHARHTAERIRHVKRGTEYEVLARGAQVQTDTPLTDYAKVDVYRGSDGATWVRPVDEMHDGRFVAATGTGDAA